jgi:hypothetical protein
MRRFLSARSIESIALGAFTVLIPSLASSSLQAQDGSSSSNGPSAVFEPASYVRVARLQSDDEDRKASKERNTSADTSQDDKSESDKAKAKRDEKDSKETKEAVEPISLPPLSTPNIAVKDLGTGTLPKDAVEGRLPGARPLPIAGDRPYGLFENSKMWVKPTYCHQPLYFEDTMLERHGHEKCSHLTPLLSGVRFYTTVLTTPYLAYLRPPLKDISNAGHYRPGSQAPCVRERAPYDPAALRFQLLTTGAAFNLTP